MEQLLKDLKKSGYELVYDEFEEAWRVMSGIASIDDFSPSAFSEIVFGHDYSFFVGITLDRRNYIVRFYKR